MDEISSINLARLNNKSHFAFMERVVELAQADDTVKSVASTQVENLKTAFDEEDLLYKQSTGSVYTEQIQIADRDRDTYYMAIKKFCQSMPNVSDSDVAAAAVKINKLINLYQINVQGQLDGETAELINLLQGLRSAEYSDEVELLGLTSTIDRLEEANERAKTYLGTRDEEGKAKVLGALKAAREVSDEAYRKLTKRVEVFADDEEDLLSFIQSINALVKRYQAQILNTKSSSSSTDTTDEADDSMAE